MKTAQKAVLISLSALTLGSGVYFLWSFAPVYSVPVVSLSDIRSMIEKEDLDEAVLRCRRRLLSFPGESETRVLLGNLYEETGENKKARAIYEGLIGKDPEDPLLHFFFGRTLYHLNRPEEAEEVLKKAQSLARALENREEGVKVEIFSGGLLGEIYMDDTKEYRKAAAEFERCLKEDPKNAPLRFRLATAYAYAGMSQSAYREFSRIVKEEPGTEIARQAENAIQYVREGRSPGRSKYLI